MSIADNQWTRKATSSMQRVNVRCLLMWQRQKNYTPEKMAELLGLSLRTIRRMYKDGEASPATINRIEKHLLIPRRELLNVSPSDSMEGESALSLAKSSGREAFEFLMTRGIQLMEQQGFAHEDVRDTFKLLRDIYEESGEPDDAAQVGLWQYYLARAKYREAKAIAAELAYRAFADGKSNQADRCLGETHFYLGNYEIAAKHLELASHEPIVAKRDRHGFGVEPAVAAASHGILVHTGAGDATRAEESTHLATQLARQSGGLVNITFAHHFRTCGLVFEGRRAEAGRMASSTLKAMESADNLPQETGIRPLIPNFRALAKVVEAWANVSQTPKPLARLLAAFSQYRATGGRMASSYWLSLAADVCCREGETELALHFLDDALIHIERTGERFYIGEVHRRMGLIKHVLGQYEDAAQHFEEAIAAARVSGAVRFELHALETSYACFGKSKEDQQQNARRRELSRQVKVHADAELMMKFRR